MPLIENPLAGKFDTLGFIEITDWFYYKEAFEEGLSPTEACMKAHLDAGLLRVAFSAGRSTVNYHTKNPLITRYFELYDPSLSVDLHENYLRIGRLLDEECCLAAALRYGKEHGMTVYGHLCMARNYTGYANVFSSKLALDESLHEVDKTGTRDASRMCYALPAVQEERLAVIEEILRMGCDALCLDFMRQPPMVQYHPAVVEPYIEKTGCDPRKIDSKNEPDAFRDWIRYRADILTGFMKEVRRLVGMLENELGRRIPVMARLPDDGFTANMIAGIDIRRWCETGLVDEIAVHPLQWIHGIWQHDAAPYVDLGRLSGVKVYGGVNGYPVEKGFAQNPVCIAMRILEQYQKGVAGISIYETNDSVLRPELTRLLGCLGDIRDLQALLEDRSWTDAWPVDGLNQNCGMDNHSGFSRTMLQEL